MALKRTIWNNWRVNAVLWEGFALFLCVYGRDDAGIKQLCKAFENSKILFIYLCISLWWRICVHGSRDGEQTCLTVRISSCCKSASVTDGKLLIAGLWRLGSHRRRKSLSVSRGDWEGRRLRLGPPGQPPVIVRCLCGHRNLCFPKQGLFWGRVICCRYSFNKPCMAFCI